MSKKKSAPKHAELEDVSQGRPDDEPGTPVAVAKVAPKVPTKPEAISKAEAVRRALAKGLDDLDDIENFMKGQFGIEMPRQQLSAYKSQIKAKAGGKKGKPGRKPKSQAVEGYLAPPEKPHQSGDQGDLLAAMEAIKPLVAALGAEKAHRIVDLLG